ncbi:MAG: potassium transporter Kup [Blastochloris viridis]|uniref:Probable potassium transport system protein Kup n=1 Tax=Blastochloris viridis TaxID=1079 RepID=A0A6N4R7I0_BLAVI|nr:MAG: potassium transporter Kup [Blastochloris viridis]
MSHAHNTFHDSHNQSRTAMFVAALGVVFGDIGTSPLYTMRESFHAAGLPVNELNVFGILSAIAWSLILVVTLKYVSIIMRADNRGEGGILALTALAIDQFGTTRRRWIMLCLGLFGAALFYGDAIITPSISVISAMEGLQLAVPFFNGYVVLLSLFILAILFSLQHHGTHKVGALFGPIMLVWFSVIGMLGLNQIIHMPEILLALNPEYALHFAANHPFMSFLTMGAVVLAVTGGEALYADMGHLGRRPIQRAWLLLVGPALTLNYFGQGALLMQDPTTLTNPFFLMVPDDLMYPMIALTTIATVIAAQAVISGAFSITHQAIQLGYLPRMEVRHTNIYNVGQIYIPFLNHLMLVAVLLLVVTFKTSSNLAAAYGIAVTGTMLMTTLLAATVLLNRNRWHPLLVALFLGVFLAIDGLFFTANLHKIPNGGWFPLLLGAAIFFIMHTWVKGRESSQNIVASHTPLLEDFIAHINPTLPHVRRTAVFLTSNLNHAPPALVYNINHNAMLHAQIIILKVSRARIPRYPASERYSVRHYPHNITTVQATFGFLERPNVPHMLSHTLEQYGLTIRHPEALSYFLSTHTYIPSPEPVLNPVQERVFILLDKLSQSAVSFFHLPRRQVIEIGNQIEI